MTETMRDYRLPNIYMPHSKTDGIVGKKSHSLFSIFCESGGAQNAKDV